MAGRPPLQNRPGGPCIEADRWAVANCVTSGRQAGLPSLLDLNVCEEYRGEILRNA